MKCYLCHHSLSYRLLRLVLVFLAVFLSASSFAQQGVIMQFLGLPPLAPKPGYVIGRIVDMQRRPVTNVEIYIGGTTFAGGENVGFTLEPDIDPQTGYFEVRVPDGLYKVHCQFNKATLALGPQTSGS